MTRTRLFRSVAFLASLGFAIFGASNPSRAEQRAPRIVIDGSFEDWGGVPIGVRDAVDPAAVICDFREVRAISDAEAVFFYIRIQHSLMLKVSGGTVGILFDADGDPTTGWSEHGLEGVDLVIRSYTGDRVLGEEARPIWVRVRPPEAIPSKWAEHNTPARMGIKRAPAFDSDHFEFRVARGLLVPDRPTPLLTGRRARVKLIALLPDGTLVDETDPFPVELADFERAETIDSELDPLSRRPKTRLRVLEWNVSHSTLEDRKGRIAQVLAALHPDLLLLNEVSETFPAEDMARILERSGIVGASEPGRIVYGRGGGDERAVIAGRFPLRPLPGLNDLRYPILDLKRVLAVDEVPSEIMARTEEGIQAAGAVATIGDLRILLTSFGLESGGHGAFEIEELTRRTQAMTIASALVEVSSGAKFDAVIAAGDFNLVITQLPLTTIEQKTETWPAPLTIINALQLDGLTNETWKNVNLPFAPGRLDFMLYSAPTLELDRAFVFDSEDLSPKWLEHHGLYRGISREASDHFPIVADFSW